ncbi:MAG TPA: precorrin-2 C(20)-methyltransferase [Propionibacteriaceae bacterium]|nr:precorrin-2 C(20)-methyltransferase [Propionibacteriaceae bacterium]
MIFPARTTATLIGVGVGPGDPDLITRKAVHALQEADVILVPSTETSAEGPGHAERIVLAACPEVGGRVRRIPFSMAERRGVGAERRHSWAVSAGATVEAFDGGAAVVVFATIGDPSVYSTFSYLAAHVREALPEVAVEVVPGITAMQALAAESLIPLVEGQETLSLVPATAGDDVVDRALEQSDSVVYYKGGRRLAELLRTVREHGRDGLLGVNIGLVDQTIIPISEVDAARAPYFSTVMVTPRRSETGGRL